MDGRMRLLSRRHTYHRFESSECVHVIAKEHEKLTGLYAYNGDYFLLRTSAFCQLTNVQGSSAMHSISMSAPRGRAATPTQVRAGGSLGKYW